MTSPRTTTAILLSAIAALALLGARPAASPAVFTTAFPPEEFAAHRDAVLARVGDAVVVLQGAPELPSYQRFRQSNHFFYLTGVEVPRALLLLDGRTRTATLFLPPRNAALERMEGPVLVPGDDAVRLTGIADVRPRDAFEAAFARASAGRVVYTPLRGESLAAGTPDAVGRHAAATAADPWDGRASREAVFVEKLKAAAPGVEIRDLDPVLDRLRMIKTPREIEAMRASTTLSCRAIGEAMRAARPGLRENDLEAIADYTFKSGHAQGIAYFALVATGGNAIYPHYHAGTSTLADGDLVLLDYAPDLAYYASDVTRMFPASGRFSPAQRELYGVYVRLYEALLQAIRPGEAPRDILRTAVQGDGPHRVGDVVQHAAPEGGGRGVRRRLPPQHEEQPRAPARDGSARRRRGLRHARARHGVHHRAAAPRARGERLRAARGRDPRDQGRHRESLLVAPDRHRRRRAADGRAEPLRSGAGGGLALTAGAAAGARRAPGRPGLRPRATRGGWASPGLTPRRYASAIASPRYGRICALAAVAAPSRPACGLRITFTGIVVIISAIGVLSRKACMKAPASSWRRIRGAMPPPMYTPRVATARSARFPASAPYAPRNRSRASRQCGQRLPTAFCGDERGQVHAALAARAGRGMREAVEVGEAEPRDDGLDLGTPVALAQPRGQLELARRPRGEVGVPALRRRGREAVSVAEEVGLPEPGAGGDQPGVAARVRLAVLEDVQLVVIEHGDRVRDRHEVVQQAHAAEPERHRDLAAVDAPADVDELGAIVDDRAGDAEARGLDRRTPRRLLAQEPVDDGDEARVVGGRERLDRHRHWPKRCPREQAEQRLGAADVTGEEHGRRFYCTNHADGAL